jgi:hypothetical protein
VRLIDAVEGQCAGRLDRDLQAGRKLDVGCRDRRSARLQRHQRSANVGLVGGTARHRDVAVAHLDHGGIRAAPLHAAGEVSRRLIAEAKDRVDVGGEALEHGGARIADDAAGRHQHHGHRLDASADRAASDDGQAGHNGNDRSGQAPHGTRENARNDHRWVRLPRSRQKWLGTCFGSRVHATASAPPDPAHRSAGRRRSASSGRRSPHESNSLRSSA